MKTDSHKCTETLERAYSDCVMHNSLRDVMPLYSDKTR